MELSQEQLDKMIGDAVTKATGPLTTSIEKLEKNNTALVAEKKTEADKAKLATEKAVKEAGDAARASGDFEAMDKSWGEKHTKLQGEFDDLKKGSDATIHKMTAGADRDAIATELALKGSEGVFSKYIGDRIGVEIRDGEAIPVYMDANGKPSAATRAEFMEELKKDAGLKNILAGSQGSGGGDVDQNGSAGNTKGTLGGDKVERTATFKARHPEL